jgi:hypothetical protein
MTAPAALLRLAGLEKFVVPGKRYPAPLPPDLEACYCYTIDGGHSILVVLENVYREGEPVQDYLVPAPVRAVLRAGYSVKQCRIGNEVWPLVWCRLPYSPEIGLLEDPGDSEY